jgi:hypothetical protein
VVRRLLGRLLRRFGSGGGRVGDPASAEARPTGRPAGARWSPREPAASSSDATKTPEVTHATSPQTPSLRRNPAAEMALDALSSVRAAPPPPPPAALRSRVSSGSRRLPVRLLFEDGTEADLLADPATQKHVARLLRVMLPPPPPPRP